MTIVGFGVVLSVCGCASTAFRAIVWKCALPSLRLWITYCGGVLPRIDGGEVGVKASGTVVVGHNEFC